MTLTWEEVLGRDDIVGGDLTTEETLGLVRGPIEEVWEKDGRIHFRCSWLAWHKRVGQWVKIPNVVRFVDKHWSTPHLTDQGIGFNIFAIGRATLHLKGGTGLDPAEVEGLRV